MKARFMTAVSCMALGGFLTPAALAQQAETTSAADIVVTGSRISVSGYKQPTPVTVIGEEVLQRDAKASIGDSIRELPSVGSSASMNNSAGAGNIVSSTTGLDTVNLRQLGQTRTLVLFDGQRVVPSNIQGAIDLGTIPTMLVERIDVVTAGASAAWGSDAVSGVVNLVLNKRFDGLRVSVDAGDSYAFDHRSYRVQAAAGTGFDNDRGRVIIAADYIDSPDTLYAKQRKWNKYTGLVNNPAYTASNNEPRYIHADNVGISQGTQGGLITDGPLKGIQFVGNGVPVPYTPGIGSGRITAGGDTDTMQAALNNLTTAYNALTLFGYASYQLTDWLKASVQINYGKTKSRNNSTPAIRQGNLQIALDNAYLPQSIKDAAKAYNLANPDTPITFIPFGTTNLNNMAVADDWSTDYLSRQLGAPVAHLSRTLKRGVFTLEGDLGGDWSWNGYYQHGEVKLYQYTVSNIVWSKYNQAIDAVLDESSGSIVCRSTLTNPGNGCVPLNLFGFGVATPEAIKYVNVAPGQNHTTQVMKEDVAGVSAQGTVPFGFPAGNIAVALGAEYRAEKGTARPDQGAIDRIYSVGNFGALDGKYNVKEAFLEAEIPLLSDSVVESLSLNTAGRLTDYSTSGQVITWKLGLSGTINSDIRLRGTVSRDIRAPNLNELFAGGLNVRGSGVDPRTGKTEPIFIFTPGNPDLKPEKAITWSGGVVLTPSFLERFSLSVDYYNIKLKDAIASIDYLRIIERCVAGEQEFCQYLIYSGPGGALGQVRQSPMNLAQFSTSGLDIQADYAMPLGEGDLRLRVVGNYLFNLTQDQLGVTARGAGAIGADNPYSGSPRARFNANATYTQGPLSLTAQGRFIGAAKLVYNWTSKDVDDNKIPARFYVDLRGSYQLTDNLQLFATVDNLLNKAPPVIASSPNQGDSSYYFISSQAGAYYDIIGRSYRIGVRFKL